MSTQSQPVRITLISSAAPLGALPEALVQIERRHGPILEVKTFLTHLIQEKTITAEEVLSSITASKIVLFDLRGSPDRAVALVQQGLAQTQGQDVAFIPIFGGGPSVLSLLRMGNFSMARMNSRQGSQRDGASTNYRRIKQMTEVVEKLGSLLPVGALRHARNWVRCINYWTNSGVANVREMLLFVAKEYAGVKVRVLKPAIFPDDGFLDLTTGQRHATLNAYVQHNPLDPTKPTVLTILFGGTTLDACVAGSSELLHSLKRETNLLPFFADGIGTAQALQRHLLVQGKPIIALDALVSIQWFRLEGGPIGGDPQVTSDLLHALNVPLYGTVTSYNRTVSNWQHNNDGVTPVETLATITFPEIDGAIEPVFLFGLRDLAQGMPTGAATVSVPGRGEHLTQRILKRIHLRRKANAEKKIALVLFNYPPGESTLGSASYLDVFASVEHILQRLKADGYTVELPTEPLQDILLQRGLVHKAAWTSQQLTAQHALRIPLAQYQSWYNNLPAHLRRDVESLFGPPPGTLLVDGTDILVAGVQFGNVVVALQPSRGVHEDPTKSYHDKHLPPHHQYIAFYRFLEETFAADAIVHVGTHGTHEFLPGKEAALSAECWPDLLLGHMPNLYLYHVVNASEAMIAKRRGYAQTITYASPGFVPAELYGEYLELEDLLSEFETMRRDNLPRAQTILATIASKTAAVNLPFELPNVEITEENFPAELDHVLDTLHNQLGAYKRTAIPMGLHVFGARLQGASLTDYLSLIARYDRTESPALTRQLATHKGLDFDQLVTTEDTRLAELDQESHHLIEQWLQGDTQSLTKQAQSATIHYLSQIRQHVEETDEVASLLHALRGGFLTPNLAGDPVRSPETYPTGRNAYQFDPTRVPTASALQRGGEIANETLRQYYEVHGSYPSSVGVILWGFETCKTFGETIGQILGYLGVTINQGEGYFIRPEPIPLTELGRPRVDVVVNICGFFRDLFPNQVRMLDLAFRMLAELDEDTEHNYVKRNTQQFLQAGSDLQSAAGRIFGPPPGEYGNRVSTLVENGVWQDESELANMFMQRSQYLYGDSTHGTPALAQLQTCLQQVELVTQVRDSHEYEVTDVDHYYEFFGGLARASQEVRGSAPTILIADTTRERIQVKSVASAIQQGVVTRILNPQWIDGLLAHNFHGAQNIADRVEYLMGLDATTHAVGTQTWSRVAQRFLFDKELRKRMLENNPYAEAEIAQKLAEAMQRGYWEPSDAERQQLRDAYMDIEQWIEAQ